MKIIIGSDHAGFTLKNELIEWLKQHNHEYFDAGTYSEESCDYPDIASKVAKAVASKEYEKGVLLCGSGIGVTISANKVKKIRAALAYNPEVAKLSRQHNDANILTMGARFIDKDTAIQILDTWLNTEFEGGRHQKRIDKLTVLENES